MKRRTFLGLLSATTANVLATTAAATTNKTPLITGGSPLSTPATDQAVRFIAFGDSGTGDRAQYDLARVMASHHWERFYDTALMLGDNIYPDGDVADIQGKFERPYSELLRRGVTFQAVLGNHDVKKGREAQINYPKFNMGGRPYYSFTKGSGLVEFFALDSTNFDPGQRRWLEDALAASKANWKIAYFHHPLYSSSDRHGSSFGLRADLEPLLIKYGVAAAFSGHDHTYERVKLQQGVQYFVSGAGGKLRRGDLNRKSPFFASGHDEAGSFISAEITPDQFRFKTIDVTGKVIDLGEIEPRTITRAAPLGK
jgi:acid phosphatase